MNNQDDEMFRKILKEEIQSVIKEIITEKYSDNLDCKFEIIDLKAKLYDSEERVFNLESTINSYKKKIQEMKDKIEQFKKIEKQTSNKYEELKSMMEHQLEHIKHIEEQNYALQSGFNQLNQRLNLVEHGLKYANIKLKSVQLGKAASRLCFRKRKYSMVGAR